MKTSHIRNTWLAVPLLAAGVTLAACGSSGSGGGAHGAGATGGGAAASGKAASAGGVTIATATGMDGTYLTDGSGRALYLWMADTSSKSTCTGACASAWPPLVTKGTATAGSGARASDIGTTTRSDGSRQVTYDGHPLYYFAGDSGKNQTNGQGSDGFGARWWLVAPSGTAITGTQPGASSSSSSGGGYNY